MTLVTLYLFYPLELIWNCIFPTPKMVKNVIKNIDSLKASGPDCIPVVVVLKNCEPELSDILAELFNLCLKEPCFPNC